MYFGACEGGQRLRSHAPLVQHILSVEQHVSGFQRRLGGPLFVERLQQRRLVSSAFCIYVAAKSCGPNSIVQSLVSRVLQTAAAQQRSSGRAH